MSGDRERQSAVDLWFPGLDDVIGEWRRARVPVAKYGVAPHVSLLYPWFPAPVGEAEVARLRAALRGFRPFTLSFRELRRFPGVLWLAPEPRETVLALTQVVTAAFPKVQPYGGQFGAPEPHLTVAKGADAVLDFVEAEVALQLRDTGPLRVLADRASVVEQDGQGLWHVTHNLPFGAG